MKPLAIAHILSSFAVGGQERVALELATWQRRHGQRVVAISLAEGPEGSLAESFRAHGVETFTVAKSAGVDASLPFRIAKLLSRLNVDVVHTHNPHALIYGGSAASIARVASVHTKHGMNPDLPRRLWLRRRVSSLVDAFVAVTPALARVAVEEREASAARLHVIPNGIDVKRFVPSDEARRSVRAELGISPSAWVVGTVGRLAPEKNYPLLVRAMTPLLDERRQLVIVGDGPERGTLGEVVKASYRAEYCHLVGGKKDPERWLAAFDVFALSSSTEGLPLVLLEAMSAGVPVVSTAVGGIPDLIERGVTGLLVPAGDERELCRSLLFLANYPTAALRMGALGREVVNTNYSLTQMAERYQALYEQIARPRTAGVISSQRPMRARAGVTLGAGSP